jgi:hypothetical protein
MSNVVSENNKNQFVIFETSPKPHKTIEERTIRTKHKEREQRSRRIILFHHLLWITKIAMSFAAIC